MPEDDEGVTPIETEPFLRSHRGVSPELSGLEELAQRVLAWRADRARPVHRRGSAPDLRQQGELVAFDIVLAEIDAVVGSRSGSAEK